MGKRVSVRVNGKTVIGTIAKIYVKDGVMRAVVEYEAGSADVQLDECTRVDSWIKTPSRRVAK